MRILTFIFVATLAIPTFALPANARGGGGRGGGGGGLVNVRGYYNQRGAYVAPHVRTRPDGILDNNRSYRGGPRMLPIPSISAQADQPEGPLISSDGPCFIPGPTTWTDTAPNQRAWCDPKRLIGGFCMIN